MLLERRWHPSAVRPPGSAGLLPLWLAAQDRHLAAVRAMHRVHAASLRDGQASEDDRRSGQAEPATGSTVTGSSTSTDESGLRGSCKRT